MTDVEVNVSTKRKSFSNKQGKKDSPKKFKLEATKTPQKGKALDKNVTPKQQNRPQNNNSGQKPNTKNKRNSESGSPKKLKPFAGTSEIQTPHGKKENKKVENKNKAVNNEGGQRKRKGQFHELTLKVKAGEKDAIKSLENKIQAIESRDDLTKTAKRKLKLLRRLKNIAEGKPAGQGQQQKALHTKSTASKRRERKKQAVNKTKESTEINVRTELKSGGEKINGKANQQRKPGNQQVAKKARLVPIQGPKSDSEESDDESNEAEDESGAEEVEDESGSDDSEEGSGDEEQSDAEEEEDENDSDDSAEEEESEEESPPQDEESESEDASPKITLKTDKTKNVKNVNLDELKKNNLVSKNQKRFVLFVGNIPYDTSKHDLIEHFKKCGEIKHIRIPTEKKSSKPRGFAYVEVENEETYQKSLSMHHSVLKGRRINVLYTQGGKKKGDEKKKEIKAKNFKLHAMRKQGKLVGSKKETQKRSFRRAKQRAVKDQQETHD